MGKIATTEAELQNFTKEMMQYLEYEHYDITIFHQEITDETIRYYIRLNAPAQYGKMFKIPNLIYDYLGVEASEIYDGSGTYEEWLLLVPNK